MSSSTSFAPQPFAPLAITRVGAVCAAGLGVRSLYEAVTSARPLARPVERYSTGDFSVRHAALVPATLWETLAHRFPEHDPAVRLALCAIEDALGTLEHLAPDTPLYVGTSLGALSSWEPWHTALSREEPLPQAPRYTTHDETAVALARALGLRGPALTVSTACTSSALALVHAADALRLNECDQALVVGVDVLQRFVHAGFDRLAALTPDDRPPAPFAAERAGMWLGEGAAAVLIAREGAALARYLGGGTSNDGVHMTAPDREGRGLARAINLALDEAGAQPSDVSFVSSHGTSTRFNDAMESAALRTVFGASAPPVHAAKPVTGHTLGACGLLEVALCVETLRLGVRPPTHTLGARDPALAWLSVDTEPAPLGRGHALSLNAAMAGHNTALLLGAALP